MNVEYITKKRFAYIDDTVDALAIKSKGLVKK